MNEPKQYPIFIELTDSYDGRKFCLNTSFIRTIRNNGRYTLIYTPDNNYTVYETYDEIIENINRKKYE